MTDILTNEDFTVSQYREKYKPNSKAALSLHDEYKGLHKDFLKLKTSIASIENENKKFQDLHNAFCKGHVILRKELETGVHAEVQILSHIVASIDSQKISSEAQSIIYIGISKLCCLHCRCMLEQTSKIFEQNNPIIPITLRVRGKHDLNFEENWICPSIFEAGYEETEASAYEESDEVPHEITIQYKIGQQSCTTIKDLIKSTKNPSKTSMYPSHSSSEDEKELAKKDIENRLDSFKITIKLLEKTEENSVKNTLTMLSLAKALHKNVKFIDFCQTPYTITPERFFVELAQPLKSNLNYNDELLLKILKSSSLVGETISEHFRSFSLHLNQTQQTYPPIAEISETPYAPPASMEYSESSSRSDSRSYKDIYLQLEHRFHDAKRSRNMNDTYPEETLEEKRFKIIEDYRSLLDEIFKTFSSEEAQLKQALQESALIALEEQAKQHGFTVIDVPGDGNCFFHAVAEQIRYLHQNLIVDLKDLEKLTHEQLRTGAIAHLLDHQEDYQEFIDDTVAKDFNSFIEKLMQGGEWADHVIITALSRALNINLEIMRSDAAPSNTISVENPLATLHLAYIVGLHYQSLHLADPLIESSTPTPSSSPRR